MIKNETEIVFVRHGETDFNKAGLYFGHLDPSLNETGISQLKNSEISLKKMEKNITKVYCSSLKRCKESLELLNIENEIEKNYEDSFKEINFGVFEGKTYKEICEKFPEEVKEMRNNWRDFKAEGAENLWEVQSRAVKKIEEIFEKHKGEKILVVAHAGIIKVILSYYLYGNLDGYWKLKVDNGSISKLCKLEDGYIFADYVNRI